MKARRASDWLPALLVFVLGIAAWQGCSRRSPGKFLLPKPSRDRDAFWDNRHVLVHAGWFTFKEALGGFVIGSALAIVVARSCSPASSGSAQR